MAIGTKYASSLRQVSRSSSGAGLNSEPISILQNYLNKIEADRAAAIGGVEQNFGADLEDKLRIGKMSAVGGGVQNLVSSGLASTSAVSGLDTVYERDVAAPARLAANSQKSQLVAQLLQPSGAEANIISQIAELSRPAGFSRTIAPMSSNFGASPTSTSAPVQDNGYAIQVSRNQAATERLLAARSNAGKSTQLTQPDFGLDASSNMGGGIAATPGDPNRRAANIFSNSMMSPSTNGFAGTLKVY